MKQKLHFFCCNIVQQLVHSLALCIVTISFARAWMYPLRSAITDGTAFTQGAGLCSCTHLHAVAWCSHRVLAGTSLDVSLRSSKLMGPPSCFMLLVQPSGTDLPSVISAQVTARSCMHFHRDRFVYDTGPLGNFRSSTRIFFWIQKRTSDFFMKFHSQNGGGHTFAHSGHRGCFIGHAHAASEAHFDVDIAVVSTYTPTPPPERPIMTASHTLL